MSISVVSITSVWYLYFTLLLTAYILCLVLVAAFFTLMERNVLASMQASLGPDKVGFFGVFQPIADALNLLVNEYIIPTSVFPILFILAPVLVLILSLTIWLFIPLTRLGAIFPSNFSLLWVIAISSLNVYAIFLSGYSSNSNYAFIGSVSAIVQMISYEVVMSILLLPVIFVSGSLNIASIAHTQIFFAFSNFAWMVPNALLFFICLLAETNRAPFDLPEAEAELVAGYNVEYSSLSFAFFFLGEYLNILSMSFLFVFMFWSGWSYLGDYLLIDTLILFIKAWFVAFCIVWSRATLPRASYDHLMIFCWKYSLFYSLAFLTAFLVFYSSILFFVS